MDIMQLLIWSSFWDQWARTR